MTRIICNRCRQETAPAPGAYPLPPKGWFTLHVRGVYDDNSTRDFCSATCAIEDLQAELIVPATSELVTEPEPVSASAF